MGFSEPRWNIEFEFPRIAVFSGFLLEMSVDYSSISNCVRVGHFVSGRKTPTSLLDKEKRMT